MSRRPLPGAWLPALYDVSELAVPLGDVTWKRSNLDPFEQYALLALVLLRRPRRILEIGTYDGATTRLLARAAPEAEVLTLDLPPELAHASTESGTREHAATGQVGSRLRGTPEGDRVTQLWGDSTVFDFTPWEGTVDLVVVDAGHEHAQATADSASALRLVSPGGIVVWDDYEDYWPGVQQAVEELPDRVWCRTRHLQRTALAVYDPVLPPHSEEVS